MSAVIVNLTLELAESMQQRTLKQAIRGIPLVSGMTQTRSIPLPAPNSNTPGANQAVLTGLASSVLTVITMDAPVDIQLTINNQTVSWTGVSSPLILPQGVNSIQITNNGSSVANVYVFQGA
jgi:hypothetical protein